MNPKPSAPEPARWATLSPLLDELLSLGAAERETRLAAWRATDPALAAELDALLDTAPAIASERFLEDDVRAVLGGASTGIGPGSVCGAWMLERPLGTGGMGSVWLARRADGRYTAQAAIKLPHPAVLLHGGAERFAREGRLLARVSHPLIAGLLDAGVAASGQPYLVLEYVQGEAIDRYCDRLHLRADQRVALFLDVLSAVAHAHGQFILHRDLKPSNILVDAAGGVKLLDFGIAKLIEGELQPSPGTAPGAARTQRAFTPDHAAPEQLQGEAVGTTTDVYTRGVLLYQLLAGRHPTTLASHTPVEQLRAVVETVPVPMSEAAVLAGPESSALRSATPRQLARALGRDLDTIVAKALKKRADERYSGAAAFAEDLERWRAGLPVLAQPDRPGYRLRLFVRRHRVAVGAAAAGLLLLLGGAATTTWQAAVARRERDEARWQAERAFARGNLFNLMLGQMGHTDAPLTQRQILDAAVKLVESQYGTQPRLAVELLLPIAGQYHSMGDALSDLAVMQRAAHFAAASGDAELVATAACSTVDTYIALDRLADAEAVVATARAAIARLAEPPAVLQATCWRYESQLAQVQGQRARALQTGLRAQRRFETSNNTGGNLYPSLLSQMIVLHQDNGDPVSAFATVDRLAAHFRAHATAQTLDSSLLERIRAVLLAEAGEIVAARTLAQQIVARFGSRADGAPPQLLLTLAQIELAGGRMPEARAALASTDAASRAVGGGFEDRTTYLRALVALAEGHADDARSQLGAADQRAPGAGRLRARNGLTPTPGTARALLLLAEGRHQPAVEAIEAELLRLEKNDIGNLALRAHAWRTAAEILLAAGTPARAEVHAQAALAAATRAARDPNVSAHVGHARLLLARARDAAGDAAGARDEAASAAASLTHGLGAEHALTTEARRRAPGRPPEFHAPKT